VEVIKMTKKEFSIVKDNNNKSLNINNLSKDYYFKTIINHTDNNIFVSFRDIFGNKLTQYIFESELITLNINKIKFELIYNRIKKVLIIKSFNKIKLNTFERYSNSILASYGFVSGYIPRNIAFYFGYDNLDDENFSIYKYGDNLISSYNSHYKIFAFSKDNNRSYLDINSFETFCSLLNNNDKFSHVIFLMMESNITNSILLQPVGYSTVLEIMVRIIYSIEDNRRTASSQLIEQFKKYCIPISEIDEKIIKLRHDVFHGKPIAYGEDADISSIKKLCKLNFLINALIMKHIGHSGYIIEIKYYNNDNTQADISFYSYMDIGNLPT
jgi:hypothetical protein